MARIYTRAPGQKPKKQSHIRKNKRRIWWLRFWASIAIAEALYIAHVHNLTSIIRDTLPYL